MLENVELQMKKWIESLNNDVASELFLALPKGKRLRAKLVMKIAGDNEDAIKLAAVIEMIHAASLLHDDVIDDAMTRRGVKSVNATEGSKQAIMLGDILYSRGYAKLVSFGVDTARIISGAVTELSIGELMDVNLSASFNPDIDKYMQMIYQKTAALIEATAKSAALIANKPEEAYATYGRNLGLAFQIVDDILDITQTSEQLGKPAMHDFEEGKTTLPYIYLYESLDSKGRKKLESLHGKSIDEDSKMWIIAMMQETQSIQKAYLYAKELGDEAVELMEEAGESSLADIVTAMLDRDF